MRQVVRQVREAGREREVGLKKENDMNMIFSTRSNGCINLCLKDINVLLSALFKLQR